MGTIVIDFDSINPEATYVLNNARELIEEPEHWHKLTEDDESRFGCNWTACEALEAVDAATGVSWIAAYEVLSEAALNLGYTTIEDFNDDPGTDHDAVLALFDAAIESTLASDCE